MVWLRNSESDDQTVKCDDYVTWWRTAVEGEDVLACDYVVIDQWVERGQQDCRKIQLIAKVWSD